MLSRSPAPLRQRYFIPLFLLAAALGGGLAAARAALADTSQPLPATIEFNRDVRPIMANACFTCHGSDAKANKSGLRLDRGEAAVAPYKDANGHSLIAIVPGKPEASDAWRRITSTDAAVTMPPPDALHQLTDRERKVLRRWIEQGAKYEPHWAYIAPVKRAPPGSRLSPDAASIDDYIGAALRERGLSPAPEADRRTLIRRVTLDLIGLPPTPKEVEDFVNDRSPGAYERVVDRLLSSPHYGERMAVPWLDLVRFADSVGFHGDQLENNFPYRDYVIDAFNRDKPFDQFTIEQLAGDLLPGATTEQRVATGFNRLNMMTREGGAQPKEYLAKYAADRVRTVATTWLGSTMACCECHDHKFDPFSTKDFYSMEAYFADVQQWGLYTNQKGVPELKNFDNDSPFPPEIEVDSPYLRERAARLQADFDRGIAAAARPLLAPPGDGAAVRTWAAQVAARLQADPQGWAPASISAVKGAPTTKASRQADGSTLLSGPSGKGEKLVCTVEAPAGPLAAVRLELLPDPTHGDSVRRQSKGRTFALSLEVGVLRAGAKAPESLALAEPIAEMGSEGFSNGHPQRALPQKWVVAPQHDGRRQAASWLLSRPVVLKEGDRLIATLVSGGLGRIRFAVSPLGCRLPDDPPSAAERAEFAAEHPTPSQLEDLAAEYFKGTGLPAPARYPEAIDRLREIAQCRNGRAFTVVTVAIPPAVTRVLPRGNWQDESGPLVTPAPPHFLPDAAGPGTPRATRLDLARWIASPQNPLTARTFVNRLWMQFFGNGLAATADDLGTRGDYPSHPELLDWLAVTFVQKGWQVKGMVRLIVTSSTYRQSSQIRRDLLELDPQNRLLAYQNPRRLDAEFVRDNALFAAGLLRDDSIGGPSVMPYQPEGYYDAMNFPRRVYVADEDDREYRRGVYVHWQRTFLHPMMANFDAPSREECTASRNLSNTPQQALTLLNDPTFVEAARGLAEKVMQKSPGDDFSARLDEAFRRVVSRLPAPREADSLRSFYQTQLEYYQKNPAGARQLDSVGLHPSPAKFDPAELAAWVSVSRVLLNLNEAIVRY